METERASLKTLLLSVGLFALLLATVGLLAWLFFILGIRVFPATTIFHTGNVNLVVFSSLAVALALLYFLYPEAASNVFSQVVIGATIVAVAVLTSASLTRTGERDILAPEPGSGQFHQVTGGFLYWLHDGSSVHMADGSSNLTPVPRTAYNPERYAFLHDEGIPNHDEGNLSTMEEHRWLGSLDASVYFHPPVFLRDFFNDIHHIAATVKELLSRPTDTFNLAVFFGGFLSLVFGSALLAEIRLPRLLRLVVTAFLIRALLFLVRYSWWESPAILGRWVEIPGSYRWLAGGWMPLAAAIFFLMIKTYNLSLVRMKEDGGA